MGSDGEWVGEGIREDFLEDPWAKHLKTGQVETVYSCN